MAILKITQDVTGQIGIVPQEIYIETNDTLATVTVPGYLNQARSQGYQFSNKQIAHVYGIDFNNGLPACLDFQIQTPANPSTGNYTLVSTSSAGDVILPVNANHIATFVGTTGTIGDDAATAINGGNIQAGLSGTAGHIISFPATAAKGSLNLTAVANTGNTVTTISNAAMGQATTVSIVDPGASTANFIISAIAAGTQHITSGSLQVDSGSVTAGSSGAAGLLVSFPPTAGSGNLTLSAHDNAGNFVIQLRNASMGQSTVISIPDPVAATANFAVAPTALVNGNLVKASGTAGLLIDSGLNGTTLLTSVTAGAGISAVGGVNTSTVSIDTTYLNKIVVTLTANQIKGLSLAPGLLISPVVAKSIYLDKVIVNLNYNSIEYAAGSNLNVQYGNIVAGGGQPLAAFNISSAALIQTQDAVTDSEGAICDGTVRITGSPSDIIDTGIYVTVDGADFTTGDSTATFTLWYKIV